MTLRRLYFKMLWEDVKRKLWAVALLGLALFFALPVGMAMVLPSYQPNEYTTMEEVIERQLKKYKNKIIDQKQSAPSLQNFQKEYIEKEIEDDEDVKIIRTKRFGMKPMYPEDACVQMELLGHNFFVFQNAETEEVNVVYKRKGNTYGLIEPEF